MLAVAVMKRTVAQVLAESMMMALSSLNLTVLYTNTPIDEAVHDAHGRGLGRGEDAAVDAAEDDDGHQEAPRRPP